MPDFGDTDDDHIQLTEGCSVDKYVDDSSTSSSDTPPPQKKLPSSPTNQHSARQSVAVAIGDMKSCNILATALTARGLDDLPTTVSNDDEDRSDTETTGTPSLASKRADVVSDERGSRVLLQPTVSMNSAWDVASTEIPLRPGVSMTAEGDNLPSVAQEPNDLQHQPSSDDESYASVA